MQRFFWGAGLGLSLFCCASAAGAAVSQAKRAEVILSTQPSAGGGSIWARIKGCGITVRPALSHADDIATDAGAPDLRRGDVAIQLETSMPRPVGADVTLLWAIRAGHAIPQSGWAERIQNDRFIPEMGC